MWRNRNAHTPNPSQPDHNCETNVTIPIPSVFNPTPVRRLALSPRAIPRSPPFGPLLSRRQHRSIERAITPPPSKATPHACIASKTDPTEKKKQLPTSPAIQTIVRTVRACPVFRSQLPFTSPPAIVCFPPPPPRARWNPSLITVTHEIGRPGNQLFSHLPALHSITTRPT